MTVEELMKPRVKCILDFPCNEFALNEIIVPTIGANGEWWIGMKLSGFFDAKEYPKIFEAVYWWEYRAKDELPEYLKFINESGVIEEVKKVTKYSLPFDYNLPVFYDGTIEKKGAFKGKLEPFPVSSYEPSTESEYNEYKDKQNG